MGEKIGDTVLDSIEFAKKQCSAAVDQTKKALGGIAGEVTSIGKAVVQKQKGNLADEITYLSRAFRAASESLPRSTSTRGEVFGEKIITRVNDIADTLRDRDIDQLVADTVSFARSRPVAYVLGAVAIGFIASRILRGSSAPTAS